MEDKRIYVLYKSGIPVKDKWLKIIRNHCDLYNPIIDKNLGIHVLNHTIEFTTKEGIETKIEDYYVCPLCLLNFAFVNRDEIHWTSDFDMDHFPPKSANGKKSILVCKECNSRYGREFDFAIESYLKFTAFLNRKEIKIPSKFRMSNVTGRYSSTLSWEGNKLINTIDFKKYPLLRSGFLNASQNTDNLKIDLTISFPRESIIHKAFLKSAYLNCFSVWGYEFAQSIIGRNIIKVLDDEMEHPLTNMGVFKDESGQHRQEGLYLIQEPKEYQCFMYICSGLQKDFDEKTNTFVLIPKLEEDSWLEFKKFQKLIPRGELAFVVAKVDKYGVASKHYNNFIRLSKY